MRARGQEETQHMLILDSVAPAAKDKQGEGGRAGASHLLILDSGQTLANP